MRRRQFLGVAGAAVGSGCLRLVDTQRAGGTPVDGGQPADGEGTAAGGQDAAATDSGAAQSGSGSESESESESGSGSGSGSEPGGVATSGWPMVGANPARTGSDPDGAGPTAGVTPEWEFEAGGSVTAPTVADGTVVVGDDNGLRAIDADAGSERWGVGGIRPSPAVVGEGAIYVAGRDGLMAAYDADSGDERWTFGFDVAESELPEATVAGGAAYVAGGRQLYALDVASGERLWTRGLGSVVRSTAAVADGTVVVGTQDALYALDAGSGETRWTAETGSASTPAIAGGTVYVGVGGGVRAVDAADGSEVWRFDGNAGQPFLSPAVADGTVYVGRLHLEEGDTAAILHALSADTGDERWRFDPDLSPPSFVGVAPAVVDGTVYLTRGWLQSNEESVVTALDTGGGTERWSFAMEGFPTPVAVAGGSAYVASRSGTLYRLTEG